MQTSRNTIQRRLVLEAVNQLRHHPTAEEIYAQVQESHPTVSRGTVYRNLNSLADAGHIRRVSHLNAADRFDFELKPHYHFYCAGCGKVFDAQLDYDHQLMDRLPKDSGFLYKEYEITFTGLCPSCSPKQEQ